MRLIIEREAWHKVEMSQKPLYHRREATRASLAYRYHNPHWDLAKNVDVYGELHSPEGMGGNFTIWLEMKGQLNPQTDLLIPEKSLQSWLSILKKSLDHRCLFEVEPFFENRVPTLENIAVFLREKLQGCDWHSLTVEESEKCSVKLLRQDPFFYLTSSCFLDSFKIDATIKSHMNAESGLVLARRSLHQNLSQIDLSEGLKLSTKSLSQLQENTSGLIFLRIQNAYNTALEWHFAQE